MVSDALQRCPVCGTDLAQQPVAGQCPDCGFVYDTHTRVWRSTQTWGRVALIYVAAGLILGLGAAALYRTGLEYVPNPMLAVVCAVAFPVLALTVRRVISGRITGRFVALTPRGIVVGTRSRPRVVPWNDFARVVERRGILHIQVHSSAIPIALDDVFENAAEAATFRAELTHAAKHYRAAGPHA